MTTIVDTTIIGYRVLPVTQSDLVRLGVLPPTWVEFYDVRYELVNGALQLYRVPPVSRAVELVKSYGVGGWLECEPIRSTEEAKPESTENNAT